MPATNGTITFLNQNFAYTLQGSGSITGSTAMRLGDAAGGFPAVVTIANDNGFSGPVFLDNGILTLGNGGIHGSVGTASIINTNANSPFPAPLTFNRTDTNLVISGGVNGNIALTNINVGTTTLSGSNTFSGDVL